MTCHLDGLLMMKGEGAVDLDTSSGSVRLIGMGSVSRLKSSLVLVTVGIFGLREKSSGLASGVDVAICLPFDAVLAVKCRVWLVDIEV